MDEEKKSKKEIYQEGLLFKKALMIMEHLIIRPIIIGIAHYLK